MARLTATNRARVGITYPNQLTGERLAVWLRADSLDLTDGAAVSAWGDESKSGANPASQATALNRPTYKTNILNGLPVVRFDGTNAFMDGKLTVAARSVFAVVNYTGGTPFPDYDGAIGGQNNDAANVGIVGYGGNAAIYPTSVTNHRVNGVATAAFTDPTSYHTVYLENPSGAYSASYRIAQDRATTSRRWIGDIAEILIYTTTLSAANILLVEEYLLNKYGHY